MTTLRQAAVAALEALEITSSEYCQGCWLEVIAALKEALARPDQLEDCKKILIERTASLTKANYRLEQLNKHAHVSQYKRKAPNIEGNRLADNGKREGEEA